MSTATVLENKSVTSIAIGGFDGMHLAHQQLFSHLDSGGHIVVIETGYANLTPQKERERYSTYAIDYFQLDKIKSLEGDAFIALLQEHFPNLKKIVVGYDFHFGKGRKYHYSDLKTMFDGEVVVVDEVSFDGDSIHSHKIRTFLHQGNIQKANAFLGHAYEIAAIPHKGQGLGKKELVATINFMTKHFLLPQEGVYATYTQLDEKGEYYPSVTFLGHRLSTDGTFVVETHIIDKEVTCNQRVRVRFKRKLRNNRKFASLHALKEQILVDITNAKALL